MANLLNSLQYIVGLIDVINAYLNSGWNVKICVADDEFTNRFEVYEEVIFNIKYFLFIKTVCAHWIGDNHHFISS